MTVGENIRRIRQERNLTQRQLGEMVGASEAYIRAYESGRRNPKPSSLEKIADALSVNPEVLANSDFDGIKAIHRLFQIFRQYDGQLFEYQDKEGNDATVEDLWDFIVYIKPLSVINGTFEYIISKMKDILNLCNKSEYKEKAKEIYSFYESCYGNEKKQLFDNICKLVNLYYPCESTSFWIYLFELIFEKKSVEEYNWIPENPQLELFIKINVENYDSTIDKVHFYKALEKEDSEWSSFSSYSMTKIFNLGHNNLLKKKLLIEIYNYENHYNFWNNMLLSSDDWNLYLQYPEIKSAIICKENISILLKEIAKLYSYKNYYGNICTTDTFDYLNFSRDKISKKVLLILYLLKENYINNYSEEINDLIERCKRLIKYEKSYPTDDNYKYMCNVLRRDEEIFNWLSRLIS